ncbi:uncharacterized protein EAE98_001725 [Botrytis deweyae]|uniref:Uncharacterized protein n=1 Tax=Botrytis deweyae TaxID=2478750 RepID=A0ABQ7IYT0_9HELO|nr:uncharacterized protein EAE98_001725 [Botrytis deweyae]KAF7937411.1 hypothetical protein EAE98_001725 [Botrytis deweyae]
MTHVRRVSDSTKARGGDELCDFQNVHHIPHFDIISRSAHGTDSQARAQNNHTPWIEAEEFFNTKRPGKMMISVAVTVTTRNGYQDYGRMYSLNGK